MSNTSVINHACCAVPAAGLAFTAQDGSFVSVSAPAASVYTLTLGANLGIDLTRATFQCTLRGGATGTAPVVTPLTDTTLTVATFNVAGAAADHAFDLNIFAVAGPRPA